MPILEIPDPFETNPDSIEKGENGYIVDFPPGKFGYKRGEIWLYSQISPGEKTTI